MTGRACGLHKPVPVILKVAVLEQMEKESEADNSGLAGK